MKPTLTIGIAAYNEEANIGHLLKALNKQKISSVDLINIVVVSDASTDGTDDIVKNFLDKGVSLIRLNVRCGANRAQEKIRAEATGDILVLLDADSLPKNEMFIECLIKPILTDESVGLTSAVLQSVKPKNFIEKVLARNYEWKRELYLSIGDGNNIYTCFGPARAFSRSLYEFVKFNDHFPTDAQSYALCLSKKKKFVSVSNTYMLFRCPSTLSDHLKQSKRFIESKNAMEREYGDIIEGHYAIPKKLLFTSLMKECILHPILLSAFICLSLYVRMHRYRDFNSLWEMSATSKKLT